jgi:hypothetical protein
MADISIFLLFRHRAQNTKRLEDPENGKVSENIEEIPGAVVKYKCDEFHAIVGSETLTCLTNGTYDLEPPTCAFGTPGSSDMPGRSCKHIYEDLTTLDPTANVPDGVYYVRPDFDVASNVHQVFCDMTTKAQNGKSGFTLCAKYDRDRTTWDKVNNPDSTSIAAKWLSNGFARSSRGGGSMTSIIDFDALTERQAWASIDCRKIVKDKNGSNSPDNDVGTPRFWMHVGSDAGKKSSTGEWDAVQFTNLFPDVRTSDNYKNLFDTSRGDTGKCSNDNSLTDAAANKTKVITYLSDWSLLDPKCYNQGDSNQLHGQCLTGDGHSFCTKDRAGSRYSNAGSAGCKSSMQDTIYWAWDRDDHGCYGYDTMGQATTFVGHLEDGCGVDGKAVSLIGTGCKGKAPDFRYVIGRSMLHRSYHRVQCLVAPYHTYSISRND